MDVPSIIWEKNHDQYHFGILEILKMHSKENPIFGVLTSCCKILFMMDIKKIELTIT